MDCSHCDSSGLDSPNSSWTTARLKEYLRRKQRGQVNGKKPILLNVIISTDIFTSHASGCVVAARSADPARTSLRLRCNLSLFRQLSIESGFHHLANRSQLHAFSQGPCLFCFIVHSHSIGDRRTETCAEVAGTKRKEMKRKNRWHCICFQEATSLPCFAMIGNGRVHRLLNTRRKVKICRRSAGLLHRTVLSLTREFAPSSRRRATNQRFLSSLDSGKL